VWTSEKGATIMVKGTLFMLSLVLLSIFSVDCQLSLVLQLGIFKKSKMRLERVKPSMMDYDDGEDIW
jgi:hypothetical protein